MLQKSERTADLYMSIVPVWDQYISAGRELVEMFGKVLPKKEVHKFMHWVDKSHETFWEAENAMFRDNPDQIKDYLNFKLDLLTEEVNHEGNLQSPKQSSNG